MMVLTTIRLTEKTINNKKSLFSITHIFVLHFQWADKLFW